jgi:hypothetical protein
VVPALFIVASLVVLIYTFKAKVLNSLVATAVILAGIPIFYVFSKRNARVT